MALGIMMMMMMICQHNVLGHLPAAAPQGWRLMTSCWSSDVPENSYISKIEARHGGMFTDLFSLFSPQAPPFIVRFSDWHAQVDQGGAGPPAALANNQGWTLQDSGVTGLPLSHAFSLHLQACVTYQCWYHDHHHHNGNICTWFFCCWPYIVFGGKSNFRKSSILD